MLLVMWIHLNIRAKIIIHNIDHCIKIDTATNPPNYDAKVDNDCKHFQTRVVTFDSRTTDQHVFGSVAFPIISKRRGSHLMQYSLLLIIRKRALSFWF